MPDVEDALDALASVYQQAFSRVQIAAERAALDAWYSTNSFAAADEAAWVESFWRVVSAATVASAGITRAFLNQQLSFIGEDGPPLPEIDIAQVERDFKGWALSPMVRARFLISEGRPPIEAIGEAATRVSGLVSAALREAEQSVINQIVVESSFEFEGIEVTPEPQARRARGRPSGRYKRLPQGGACGFCLVAADKLYGQRAVDRHPLGSFHTFCRCTWRRLTPAESAGWEQKLAGGEWRSVIKERATTGTGA